MSSIVLKEEKTLGLTVLFCLPEQGPELQWCLDVSLWVSVHVSKQGFTSHFPSTSSFPLFNIVHIDGDHKLFYLSSAQIFCPIIRPKAQY